MKFILKQMWTYFEITLIKYMFFSSLRFVRSTAALKLNFPVSKWRNDRVKYIIFTEESCIIKIILSS